MKFNGTEITLESIQKTRLHFVNIAIDCINGAKSSNFHVNDLDSYIKSRENDIEKYLHGENDGTFTFIQYAYFIQTGEMIALLR